MEGLRIEQVLLLLVFILLPVLNWLLQRIRSRVESQLPEERPVPVARPPRSAAPPRDRRRLAADPARREEQPPLAPARRRRFTRKAFFRSPRDLKNAIILMTILGPCRAQERRDAE